ncbi:MAG: redoxin domain-containing protein [Aquisalinus sp.]|nr:redoxin domain-containing protein [Aquisalinus sp.]
MKTTAIALGLTAFVAFAPASATPTVGEAMPAFDEVSIDGVALNNETLADTVYVLEWTNHDCPFVRKHYDAERANMQNTQGASVDAGAVWISVISSAPGKQGHVSVEEARNLTTSRGAKPTHIILDEDGNMGKAFDAKTTPHMYVADRTGTLRYAGAIDSIRSANPADIDTAENYVLAAVNSVVAGKEVANKQSTPYGCAVKY